MSNKGNALGLKSGSIAVANINGNQITVNAIDISSNGDGWFDAVEDSESNLLRPDGFIDASKIMRLIKP